MLTAGERTVQKYAVTMESASVGSVYARKEKTPMKCILENIVNVITSTVIDQMV